ncbi:MAG TPA: hypothetical protein ENH10_05990 [Bacteroidetes bacterium]|nr:hypothetical protein [Bacteroidota bacterium]HEX04695.1 hypothetical protein [Bacteroidota bacterium]
MRARLLHILGYVIGWALLSAPLAYAESEMIPSLTFSLLRAFLALVLVLALFFLLIFVVRRYYPKVLQQLPRGPRKGEHIDIRSSCSLGSKRFLYVVKVGKTNYLIGGTDSSLNKIDQWSEGCEEDVENFSEKDTLNKSRIGTL